MTSNKKISVESLAADKKLPVKFLIDLGLKEHPRGVQVPYLLPDGKPAPIQRLLSTMENGEWFQGNCKPPPYGLDRLPAGRTKGYIVFCEKEWDCWTLWYHKIPALGFPTRKQIEIFETSHLGEISRICLMGNTEFRDRVCDRLVEFKWKGQFVYLPINPNEIFKENPDQFEEALNAYGRKGEQRKAIHPEITQNRAAKWQNEEDPQWPDSLGEAALHGLAGEFVRTVEKYSEADRIAILAHFLAIFGASVGRGPYSMAADSRHPLQMWPIIVGRTSKGRKGSSWAPNRRLFDLAEPTIVNQRKVRGLASGEGLIWAVRDPGQTRDKFGKFIEVEGVEDKRLLVVEEEFSSILQVAKRQGNVLSQVIRSAWDDGYLQTLAKNCPAKATDSHIVIVGHVSADELVFQLDKTEIASGFANRFLFFCSKRARILPEGPSVPQDVLNSLADKVRNSIEKAREIVEMKRDETAKEIWKAEYTDLSEERHGLLGAVTSRAEAQVLRLSLIYAALDGSSIIEPTHLQAALAVWRYAEQSADCIFGDKLGNPLADQILKGLRANGKLTRNEIYGKWGKNRGIQVVQNALNRLLNAGKARRKFERGTVGRPTEVWMPT